MRSANRGAAALFVLTVEALLSGCAGDHPTAPAKPPSARAAFDWQTTLGARHPLVGHFYDPATQRDVPRDVVLERMRHVRFLFLGEKHDNPDHHRFEAMALAHVSDGRQAALVMEMIPRDEQPIVDGLFDPKTTPDLHARDFQAALHWDKTGWPPFAEYQPVFEVVVGSGIRLYAGDLPSASAHAIAHRGADALDPELVTSFHLSTALPSDQDAAMEKEIADVHCGMLPAELVPRMVLAQRARDATLAQRMLDASTSPGRDASQPPLEVVMVSGAGHARTDRAVPKLLQDRGNPKDGMLSIGMLEVDDARATAPEYAAEFQSATLPFDVVWFTPRANDDDPCATMRSPAK